MRDDLVAFRDRLRVPAIGAAVVTSRGGVEPVVLGRRHRDREDPVAIDDQWHIGSCGKSITAVLYARLVEMGQAGWGVPILSLFPDLAPDLDPGWSGPTIDEVFHSRSGMRANLPLRAMLHAYRDDRPLQEQRTEAVVSAMARPPRRRGRFRYSNLGYIVAGAAIERLTGMPFEDALRRYVLDPLEIGSAGFGPPPDIRGHAPKVRLGSLVAGRGAAVEPADVRGDNPAVLTPAGRLHLDLADWARFLRLFLNEGEPLLKPDSVEHLVRMPTLDGEGMAMGWAAANRDERVALGMQGSNTMWSATAMIDAGFARTAMVVVNDGRTRVLSESARLAVRLLRD